ncbi:hypothetical protein BAE42_30710 [Mesorhizobium loti]|nr:hypothetical protein BAE42_30710 [Mesorhizobium loti]OBQ68275.1 hypothetical protein A8146_12220 [Mesorhizobium loti]
MQKNYAECVPKWGTVMFKATRREFLKTAASTAAVGTGMWLAGPGRGQAAETITATEWGGVYVDSVKAVASKQSSVDINWQLYTGGGATILPIIKARWPKPGIDLVAGWTGMWKTIADEGWAEPITLEKVPNLADIPQKLLYKDKAGNIINIPRKTSSTIWYYREDTTPFQLANLDDLLDPRLKGKICFPVPTLGGNLQMVSMALHKGGDERNMEPAWDFIKKLASSGNIGRVANSDIDIQNSITSGETSVTIQASSAVVAMSSDFKIRYLTKMERQTGFLTFIFDEGWCVLKGGNTDAAFKFANFAINPENDEELNRISGGVPANVKSKVSDIMKPFALNNEETDRYAYLPDWSYLSEQSNAWMQRWEQEIVPLL